MGRTLRRGRTDPFAVVRETAAAWPDVRPATRYDGMPILQVDGRFMAGLAAHAEHGTLVVRVEPEQRALLLDEAPDTYYLTPYHEPHPVVLVRLHRVDRAALWDLLAMSRRITRARAGRPHATPNETQRGKSGS